MVDRLRMIRGRMVGDKGLEHIFWCKAAGVALSYRLFVSFITMDLLWSSGSRLATSMIFTSRAANMLGIIISKVAEQDSETVPALSGVLSVLEAVFE